MAEMIVDWQIKKQYLNSQDRALYRYAYELLLGQVINLSIACLLAFLFHAYVVVAVYLLAYIPLRSYTGGHHAASSGVCTVVSAVILAVACMASRIIPSEMIVHLNGAVTIVASYVIFYLVPVDTANKPLDIEEKRRYRKKSIEIWMIETAAWIVLYGLGYETASLSIILAHVTMVCMIFLGILKNNKLVK